MDDVFTADGLAGILACPDCRGPLGADLGCGSCGARFAAERGVPCLLPSPGASNADVRAFYEEQPFPDYEDLDSPRALRERAHKSRFAALLDADLPLGGHTLEAGCGTGQLGNFLALSQRSVVGLDFCRASLELAQGFRDRFGISHARFVQGDLFRPPFCDEAFESVVSLGVLHHTDDPECAFQSLVRLLKPGGHFVLGLYNRFGRIPTRMRGAVIRALGPALSARLDPVVRRDRRSARRRHSWLRDQYFHPLEKMHTVGEVLGWFERAGLSYVNAVPKIVFGESFADDEALLEPGIEGSRFDHLVCQLGWAVTHGWEGGLFILIGRKPAAVGPPGTR